MCASVCDSESVYVNCAFSLFLFSCLCVLSYSGCLVCLSGLFVF